MADDEKGRGDTPGNGTQGDEGDEGQQGSPFYVGSYKTREDAEKGFQEKEAYIAKLRSEHDKAQAHLEKMQAEVLGKLADAATSRKPADTAETKAQKQREIEKLREEIRTDPANAVDLFNSWLVESETNLSAKMEQKVTELAKTIEALSGRLVTLSPDYQQNKELVESLQKKGLSLQTAIEIAKEFAPVKSEPARSDRSEPPGTTGGATATGREGEQRGMPQEMLGMLDHLVPGGLSEAERKRLARRA